MQNIELSTEQQQNGPVQVMLVVTIVSILLMLAAKNYEVPIVKSRITEVMGFAGVLKQEMTLFYAEKGRWPEKKEIEYIFDAAGQDNNSINYEVKNGSFLITFDTKDKSLGLRKIAFNRIVVAGTNSTTVLWHCGNNQFFNRVIYYADFQGNLEEPFIPSVCKVK